MFMNVGYTPPPPVWPPKTKSGMGAYERQNFVTPQRLIDVLRSAQIQIPAGWDGSCDGMGVYLPQNFVVPQRLMAPLQSAAIQIPQGWGMGDCGCGGKCGGCGDDHSHGMGLFDSGTDISGWGWGEWAVVGVGAAAGLSLLSNVSSGARGVGRAIRKRRRA